MIYCDSLSFASAREAVRWSRELGTLEIGVLEPKNRSGMTELLLRTALVVAGYRLSDASFFAGHMKNRSGESIYITARRLSGALSFRAAEKTLASSPALSSMNRDFERNTILLFLAKSVVFEIGQFLLRLMVVGQLADSNGSAGRIVLRRPTMFDPEIIEHVVSTETRFYGGSSRLTGVRSLFRQCLIEAGRRIISILKPAVVPVVDHDQSTLLTVQEDDLGIDRSYRLQPHWLSENEVPTFSTYIVERSQNTRSPYDSVGLSKREVTILPRTVLLIRGREDHVIYGRLRRARWISFREAIRTRASDVAHAAVQLWTLVGRARELAHLCRALHVGVFLTGEPYLIEADAIQLVAPSLTVKTIAFQYSNLAFQHPIMMTTCDEMVVFSRRFEPLWRNRYCAPGSIIANGYVFDSSFVQVKARAQEARQSMREAGAKFVLCYFDESVQEDRYGLISDAEHRHGLLHLVRLVLEDSSVGLIVKSQFERNSPSRIVNDAPEFNAAIGTGRYLEMTSGKHRNIVFPAEAALAADIAIGHAVGATAALEAALAGRRCVLLNPYGFQGLDIFGSGRIVFDNLEEVLTAIAKYRAGDPAWVDLGDWTPIASHFDPFRDGRSAWRLRTILEAGLTASPWPEPELTSTRSS